MSDSPWRGRTEIRDSWSASPRLRLKDDRRWRTAATNSRRHSRPRHDHRLPEAGQAPWAWSGQCLPGRRGGEIPTLKVGRRLLVPVPKRASATRERDPEDSEAVATRGGSPGNHPRPSRSLPTRSPSPSLKSITRARPTPTGADRSCASYWPASTSMRQPPPRRTGRS